MHRPYDSSHLLPDSLLQQSYSVAVQNKFGCLSDAVNNNVDDSWESFQTAVQDAADEITGPWKNIRHSWLSTDTYSYIKLKSAARVRNDNAKCKRLQGVFKARAKADHNTYLSSIADGLASVGEQIANRRIAIYGLIARLSEEPAHQALHAHVDLSLGHLPGWDWKHRPGRPNNRWVDQVHNDSGNMPSTLWRSGILCWLCKHDLFTWKSSKSAVSRFIR